MSNQHFMARCNASLRYHTSVVYSAVALVPTLPLRRSGKDQFCFFVGWGDN